MSKSKGDDRVPVDDIAASTKQNFASMPPRKETLPVFLAYFSRTQDTSLMGVKNTRAVLAWWLLADATPLKSNPLRSASLRFFVALNDCIVMFQGPLTEGAEMVTIEGGNHKGFGSYYHQPLDWKVILKIQLYLCVSVFLSPPAPVLGWQVRLNPPP